MIDTAPAVWYNKEKEMREMAVRLILGAVGSGKTRHVINEIHKTHDAQPARRCVVLVPSYYSHETEKLIIDEFGGTGLNNIEVTSFEKLARELLKGSEKKLAAPGKHAVMTRAVSLTLREISGKTGYDGGLIAAMGKRGFIEIAASLISELHRYMVTAEDLRTRAAEMEECTLRQKLEITALISENYEKLLRAADYIDSDEDLLRLSQIAGNSFGADVSIWLDRFDELLPQQREVLRAIADSGAELCVTFSYSGENTYYGTLSTIKYIKELYPDTETVTLDGAMRHIKSAPELAHLFSTWHDRAEYAGEVNNAEIFEARDAYTEAEHTACRILDLVREDGYRFRDIAVICGDPESYSHIIEAVFGEYDIPYYSDERYTIAEHPIAMQVLSVFDIIEGNWDYLSMFTYLRAGFVYTRRGAKYKRIPSEDIDRLENHVIKRGIRGKSMWLKPWTSAPRSLIDEAFAVDAEPDTELSALETLRATVAAPLEKYSAAARSARTVTDHCTALYEFLEDINLYQGLKTELLSMAFNRATAEAQRFGQIWNLILDLLDQINTALGAAEATTDEFSGYLRAAMGQCAIRTIPSGVDRVFIGSVEKNRSEHTKVLFAIGATAGTFPSEQKSEGFLSNADRERLNELNISLAPVTALKTEKGYNNVYKTLSSVTDKLLLSYPLQTPDGQGCRPSQTVTDIRAALPRIPVYDDIVLSPDAAKTMFISTPKATLHKLLIHPVSNPLWKHVNDWFEAHDEWRSRLIAARSVARGFADRRTELSERLAKKLYPGLIYYSPTRLNTYAKCPYMSFLEYGIGAREREEYELNAADAGSYAHELVRRFCAEIDEKYDWKTITDAECEAIVQRITDETIKNVKESGLADKERAADILRRLGSTVRTVSKTIRESISNGSFVPLAYEKKVRSKLSDGVGIVGTIDRLDICRHDGIDEYRIIDYKTGKKEFSVAEICAGIDMQPVVYSLVMRQESVRQGKNALITGMYYEKVRGELCAATRSQAAATIARNIRNKNTMLDGATFVATDANGDPVPEAVDRIENAALLKGESLFFGKKGAAAIGGNIRPLATSDALMDAVRDRIKETDMAIRGGDIEPAPLCTGQSNACSYCAYAAVCKFDEDKKRERDVDKDDAEIWEQLEGGDGK